MKVARGVNGAIRLLPSKLRIIRKGFTAFLTHGFKGDKEIFLSEITAIQFKKAGALTNGYIQFSLRGGREAKKGLWEGVTDENTVVFNRSQQQTFESLKSAIERARAREMEPSVPRSDLEDLEKLASLRDKGIISDDEFQAKKRQILGL